MELSNIFTIESIALASTAFFNIILFIIIMSKKNKTKNIYYFSGFVFSMFVWVITTWLFYVLKEDSQYLNLNSQLIYFGPCFIPMFMILFIKTFPKEKLNFSKFGLTLFLIFPFLFSITTLVPGLIVKNTYTLDNLQRYIEHGPLYWSYFIYMLTYFMIVIFLMIKKYIILKGIERNQIELIFLCLTIGSIVGVYLGLFAPTFGNFSLFWVGPFYPGYLVLTIFYGIIRYGLFDIKLVVTEFLTLTTWMILFIKILFSKNKIDLIVDSIIFILVIISGILIIRAIFKETSLREKDDQLVNNITSLNQKLENTNLQLKELDQKKSEFMSLATHQLRAPLTAMKGYSSMILDGTFGKIENPEIEDAVNKISRSTTDLTMIVEDYLNISRIEQGSMVYNFSNLNVVDILKDIIESVKNTANRLGLIINLNYDTNVKYNVKVDEGKIKQVFLNIIDNAIKYTPEGEINIFINKNKDGKILVKIEDTGVGIKPEVLPNLFNKFVRAPDASKVNILGTGLGLYVAGQILKAHNGRAWVESLGEKGKGSRFYVELNQA